MTRPPEGAGWLFEPKLDGYRVLCRVEDGEAAVLTRRGNDWTERFEAIAAATRALPCRAALIDGEAVVYDSRGVTSFQRLQNALTGTGNEIVLVAFDLLHLDGWDLTRVPLVERKTLLERLLEDAPPTIRYGEHVTEDGAKFFAAACKLGLEGIVAKRAADPYRAERTRSWLKIKCLKREEFVIVGFTDPGGSRTGFGALLVATRDEASSPLRYAGKVGTGFDERTLKALYARLRAARTPHVHPSSAQRRAVLAAAFTGSSRSWSPRLPTPSGRRTDGCDTRSYAGLREDKPAERDRPGACEASAETREACRRGARRQARRSSHASRQGAVPRTRHHETATGRLLARGRRRRAAAAARPAAHAVSLPRRLRRAVLLSKACRRRRPGGGAARRDHGGRRPVRRGR